MNRYLLDTHILIWLLTGDDRLNKNIREDIEYFQHFYYVSVETLREIVILQSLKKIKFDDSVAQIVSSLDNIQIVVIPVEIDHIKALEKLPARKINGKLHEDPSDRLIIAQSIATQYTLVSADAKFPPYEKYGLQLLVNEK